MNGTMNNMDSGETTACCHKIVAKRRIPLKSELRTIIFRVVGLLGKSDLPCSKFEILRLFVRSEFRNSTVRGVGIDFHQIAHLVPRTSVDSDQGR